MNSGGSGPEFVIVDGDALIPVPRSTIAPPAMNFGQMHRWEDQGHEPLVYSCAMHMPTFIGLTGDWFGQWREDMLADLAYETPVPGSAEAHWHGLGTPDLESLVAADPALAAHLLLPQALELCQLIGAQGNGALRYCMMSVDSLMITPDAVRMDGVAVRLG